MKCEAWLVRNKDFCSSYSIFPIRAKLKLIEYHPYFGGEVWDSNLHPILSNIIPNQMKNCFGLKRHLEPGTKKRIILDINCKVYSQITGYGSNSFSDNKGI